MANAGTKKPEGRGMTPTLTTLRELNENFDGGFGWSLDDLYRLRNDLPKLIATIEAADRMRRAMYDDDDEELYGACMAFDAAKK